jgi:two-component system response regulator AtoC
VNILIIEDEESFGKLLSTSLKQPNNSGRVDLATSLGAAKSLLNTSEDYDLIVCDIALPDGNGLEFLNELKAEDAERPVIMMTAHGSIDSALVAMKNGAYDYLQKPFEPEELEIVLQRALREKLLQQDYRRLKQQVSTEYHFDQILGQAEPMKQLFNRMRKAAETKSTVLIQGESGTGKELIARAIHFNSPRKEGPFVTVDCGSIPANLIESEIFGHAKGAFTGAISHKKGLAEEAHQGSLFLDEIGELPLDLQTKLLRLLQESSIRRVGENSSKTIDVRVIAATNRNLELEVKEKRFREDLFYRLNVIPLNAPSLRERKEDIPLLTQHFLEKFKIAHQRKIEKISPSVIQRLMTYEWPGNVRQLENIVEQMVVMSDRSELTDDLLPLPLSDDNPQAQLDLPETEWDLKKAIAKVNAYTEEYMIRRALRATQFNKTKAAELLKISRRALIYKTQEYGLEESE